MHTRQANPGVFAAVMLGGLLGLAACPAEDRCKDDSSDPECLAERCRNEPTDPICDPVSGPGAPAQARSIGGLDRPIAAALDPDGRTVFVTAYDERGLAQLYSLPTSGGPPMLLPTGGRLSHPVAMAMKPDGSALFISDIGDPGGTGEETGAVLRLSLSGESTDLSMGAVKRPSGVAVGKDGKDVYVTGADRDDGQPGVWRIAEAGGGATLLYKGEPFSDPSGIVVAHDGAIYVIDATALGPREGAVLRVAAGSATIVNKMPLLVGFPSGIAQAGMTHRGVLLAGLRPKDGKGVIYSLSMEGELNEISIGAAPLDPGSLARAAKANVWVIVESASLSMMPSPEKAPGQLFQLVP